MSLRPTKHRYWGPNGVSNSACTILFALPWTKTSLAHWRYCRDSRYSLKTFLFFCFLKSSSAVGCDFVSCYCLGIVSLHAYHQYRYWLRVLRDCIPFNCRNYLHKLVQEWCTKGSADNYIHEYFQHTSYVGLSQASVEHYPADDKDVFVRRTFRPWILADTDWAHLIDLGYVLL